MPPNPVIVAALKRKWSEQKLLTTRQKSSAITTAQRRKLAGLCIRCGKTRTSEKDRRYAHKCYECAIKDRMDSRKRAGSRPHEHTGIGRPPIVS